MTALVSLDDSLKTSPLFDLTSEFQDTFELLESTRQNVFLTGKAGTGKSTFLGYFREQSKKNIVVVAPTGIAALNVQGQTIHSLFRFSPGFIKPESIKPDRRKLFRELELLIIDEISMVRADVFEGIEAFLRLNGPKKGEAFGGVQICIIGDPFQLPPVVSREEQAFFQQYYHSPFFFSTQAYEKGRFQKVEFDTVHRQNEEGFIEILNAIRSGKCTNNELQTLNQRVNPTAPLKPGSLVIATTNALAEEINQAHLENLPGAPRSYSGVAKGDFGLKGPRLPAPEQLMVKMGAQVMFVKNDPSGRWVNGTIGIVEALGEESIRVRTEDGLYKVEPEKWKTVGYELDEEEGKIVEKSLGSYTQFPLVLAWAITIHKSQGKTLSKVIIELGRGAFAAGQLYVALSRCKSLEGITLKKPITYRDVYCDKFVTDFMKDCVPVA